ncbi:hypothetical protein MHY1_00220 [Methylovirgula sp. HY1]|nr:hypothetical protein MHY1_00220 [Methylovirgula sp. HY1]
MIQCGGRLAFRDSRVRALIYTYEAASRGVAPIVVIDIGRNERLGPREILHAWEELGLPPADARCS